MKRVFAFAIISMAFTSCLKTEETFEIKQDNSGTYTFSMNMDGMLSQLKSMGSAAGQAMPDNIPTADSTIYLKTYTDTASSLSDEEKKLLSRATAHIHVNDEKDEFSIKLNMPFDNMQQMVYLKQNAFKLMDKLKPSDDAMQGMNLPGMGADNPMGGDGNMNPLSNAFSFSAENNVISNKITDTASVSKLADDSNLQMLKMMLTMMGDATNTVTFILPSPVKKYSGPQSKLSDDKKTITFITSLSDELDKPSSAEYSVEY